jgi:hypothetical protein
MIVSLSEAFIMSSESRLRRISCVLRDGGIGRLFGLGGEMSAERREMKLSGACHLMDTIDETSEVDR